MIADAAGLTTITDMPGFLNLDYGLWEGLTSDEAKAQDELAYAKYQTYAPDAVCPGGETLARAAERGRRWGSGRSPCSTPARPSARSVTPPSCGW